MSLMVFFVSCAILLVSFLMFIFDDEELDVETILASILASIVMSFALSFITFLATKNEYVILKTTAINKETIVFTHRNEEHEINIPDKYKNKKLNIVYDYSSFFDVGLYCITEAE